MLFSKGLAIDLGTANTLIYRRSKGVVLDEPSVVAVRVGTREAVAVGREARMLMDASPGELLVVRPVREGVVADFKLASIMLKMFLRQARANSSKLVRTGKSVISVSCGINDMEKHAAEEAARIAGAHKPVLLDDPIAAAMGAGLDVERARGCMVLDIGGGLSTAAVISMGGIVVQRTSRIGGDYLNKAIVNHVREKYGVMIGENTAELVKIRVGSTYDAEGETEMMVCGRNIVTGMPDNINITREDVRMAIAHPVYKIVELVTDSLEQTPSELASDIYEDGLTILGGGALLRGLRERLERELATPVIISQDPMRTIINGAGMAMEHALSRKKTSVAMSLI